jgi:uncharacterized lipoprotein YmbA
MKTWILVIAAALLCGCGQKPYNKHLFSLAEQQAGPIKKCQGCGVLQVKRLSINAPFGAKVLVYRTGVYEYQTDFYNEFIIPPAVMITQKVQNKLAASGLFERVAGTNGGVNATEVLEGNILDFYGDMQNRLEPKAVAAIEFFIISAGPEQKVLLNKIYRREHKLANRSAEGLVAAYDYCLEEIIAELKKDIAAVKSTGDEKRPNKMQGTRTNLNE